MEAALSAAVILEQHGYPLLLLDLESVDQLDHVVFVFRRRGRFGAIAQSRDPGLYGRKPVYRNIHSLALSYAAPFIDQTGHLKGYGLYDLKHLRGNWRLATTNVWFVERALIKNRHHRIRLSRRFYRYWHRRYLAFKRSHPHDRPAYYPNRSKWLK